MRIVWISRTADICQQPHEFGYQSVKLLYKLVIEKKEVGDLKLPKSRQIFIPTITVKKDAALAYLKKCNAWAGQVKASKAARKKVR